MNLRVGEVAALGLDAARQLDASGGIPNEPAIPHGEGEDEREDGVDVAVNLDEPHRRIASLLAAFQGDWVPTELIGAVASAKQYQEDYQRRIRDLRYFDWEIRSKQERPASERVRVFYRAASMPALPSGDLAGLVRRIERERAVAKATLKASSAGDVKEMAKLAARELADRAETHPAG